MSAYVYLPCLCTMYFVGQQRSITAGRARVCLNLYFPLFPDPYPCNKLTLASAEPSKLNESSKGRGKLQGGSADLT